MKNSINILIIIFLLPLFGFSQSTDAPLPAKPKATKKVKKETKFVEIKEADDGEEIFTIVEKMPEFPGGQDAMMKYLEENIKYPPKAKANGIQGKVYINFIVDKSNGELINIRVIRGVHKLLDNEAIRVIKKMPNWKPGIQRGKPVNVSYNIPINFKLKGKTKKKKEKSKVKGSGIEEK